MTDPRYGEMVERVARAIEPLFDWTIDGRLGNDNGAKDAHAARLEVARAAIEAMREPTDNMLDAPEYEDDHCDARYMLAADFVRAWHAMIDAALSKP